MTARDLTRILLLASSPDGELLATVSPVIHETVLLVFYLTPAETRTCSPRGQRGDHNDAVAVRAAHRAALVCLGDAAFRMVPDGDVHQVRVVTASAVGLAWLAQHGVRGVAAALNPVTDTAPLASPAEPAWTAASWAGNSWRARR